MRIALHVGPVFEKMDPFTGYDNLYGAHVNRAARIEPVTDEGCIYASEQFIATLIEERSRKPGFNMSKLPYTFTTIGTIPLAKDYGTQAVFLMKRRQGK